MQNVGRRQAVTRISLLTCRVLRYTFSKTLRSILVPFLPLPNEPGVAIPVLLYQTCRFVIESSATMYAPWYIHTGYIGDRPFNGVHTVLHCSLTEDRPVHRMIYAIIKNTVLSVSMVN